MDSKKKKCIILANGQAPAKSVFNYLFANGYEILICADGGANSAARLGLTPDYVIGDLDSINEKALKFYQKSSNTEVIQLKRQNDTDVEKALKHAIKMKFKEVLLLGATGDRLDHTFCNLGIALKFDDKIKVKILHQKSVLAVYENEITLKTTPDEIISLYAISEETKITSQGLKYPLADSPLPFGRKESTSNVATGNEVHLKVVNGKIFVIREFNVLKKNGFFS